MKQSPLFPLAKTVFAAYVPVSFFRVDGRARILTTAPKPEQITIRECNMALPFEDMVYLTVAKPVVLDVNGFLPAQNLPGFVGYYETADVAAIAAKLKTAVDSVGPDCQ